MRLHSVCFKLGAKNLDQPASTWQNMLKYLGHLQTPKATFSQKDPETPSRTWSKSVALGTATLPKPIHVLYSSTQCNEMITNISLRCLILYSYCWQVLKKPYPPRTRSNLQQLDGSAQLVLVLARARSTMASNSQPTKACYR